MPYARILRKGQLTLPKKVRDTLNVNEGDIVDFEINGTAVTIRSKVLVEKKGGELWANIQRMHENVKNEDPGEIERLIEEAIREVRQERRNKAQK
jgi:AbrB family looped-hinge helix DNA binding protein